MDDAVTERPSEFRSLAEGVWIDTMPVRFLGLRLTATMAVLRLSSDALLVYSPLRFTEARRHAIEAIGTPTHLYAPNNMHHSFIAPWAAHYPAARVHAPASLLKKRRDLRIDRHIGAAPEPAFAGALEEVRIEGFRLEESVLFHRASATLIVADLVHNVGHPDHRWTATYTHAMGFRRRVALSRMIRWTGFSDRRQARRSLDAVLALPFDKVVVGHGTPVVEDAKEAVAAAYAWLRG